MSVLAHRYVEVTYRLPDDSEPHFRAVVTWTTSPDKALLEARRNLLAAHPNAVDIEEFLHRKITPQRAAEISARMDDESWEGWFE